MSRMQSLVAARVGAGMLISAGFIFLSGCAGLWANLLWDGSMVDAVYPGLEEKKVAVVCIADNSLYAPGSAASMLARRINKILEANVEDIEVVDQQTIRDWIDHHDWDRIDYVDIGKGLGVDRVVAVELEGFNLHNGATMYKGTCDLRVTVYDMEDGGKEIEIADALPVAYPRVSSVAISDTREDQFRKRFVQVIAHNAAKNFYRYDIREDLAIDSTDIAL
jgi:hypothetical protein